MAPTRIPGVEYAAMPRAGAKAAALVWPPRLIVIHDTGNPRSTRYDEARYAATRTDAQAYWTSAHAYTDAGGVLGSLPLNLQAWAAYGYANRNGLHIEMCKKGGTVEPATIARTTALVRQLLALGAGAAVKLSPADVAAGKRGICGHRDITIGLGVGNHEDPGADFDWAGFMAQVNGAARAADTEEEMSFANLQILPDVTSVAVPGGTIGGGSSATYLALCNETFGRLYALRIWTTTGDKVWTPIDADGLVKCESGQVYGWALPNNTRCVSIKRMAIDELGQVVDVLQEGQVGTPRTSYAGPLSFTLER